MRLPRVTYHKIVSESKLPPIALQQDFERTFDLASSISLHERLIEGLRLDTVPEVNVEYEWLTIWYFGQELWVETCEVLDRTDDLSLAPGLHA